MKRTVLGLAPLTLALCLSTTVACGDDANPGMEAGETGDGDGDGDGTDTDETDSGDGDGDPATATDTEDPTDSSDNVEGFFGLVDPDGFTQVIFRVEVNRILRWIAVGTFVSQRVEVPVQPISFAVGSLPHPVGRSANLLRHYLQN